MLCLKLTMILLSLGCALMCKGKAIAYDSKQSKKHECNYATHDVGIATVVLAVKIWRHHFYGEKCHILIDAKNIYFDKRVILDMEDMVRVDQGF